MSLSHQLSNGYEIRLLKEGDDVLSMIKEFHALGPHKDEILSDDYINEVVDSYVGCDITQKMFVVLTKDDEVVGLLFAMASEGGHLVIKSKIGFELVWWVDPKHRKSGMGVKLLEAFEAWGNAVGCTHLIGSHIHGNKKISDLYKSNGYTPIEESYIKVLS